MPTRHLGGGRYQWGKHGKIYRGKGARARAERQGRAARSRGYGKRKKRRRTVRRRKT